MKSLTTLFYFTTFAHSATLWLRSLRSFISLLTITMVLSSSKYFFLWNFSVFIKFACATIVSPSGSSVEPYMLYYPISRFRYSQHDEWLCLIVSSFSRSRYFHLMQTHLSLKPKSSSSNIKVVIGIFQKMST